VDGNEGRIRGGKGARRGQALSRLGSGAFTDRAWTERGSTTGASTDRRARSVWLVLPASPTRGRSPIEASRWDAKLSDDRARCWRFAGTPSSGERRVRPRRDLP
jgi:hypothetical protein